MKNPLITIEKADGLRLCVKCGFAGRLKKQEKPCNYHTYPSLNYRNIPAGMCALRPDDRCRMFKDYGKDRRGRLAIK